MEPIRLELDDRLAEAGDVLPLAGHVDQDSYSLGDHDFSLPAGIDYDLVITNAGEGILVTGMLRCEVVGTCDRCLEEARFQVAGEVDGYYPFEEPEPAEDEDDVLDWFPVEDDAIDLAPSLLTTLVMETPFVVLCRPDCRGLCPVCGANLNEGDCGHAASRGEARPEDGPFAALAGLDLSGGDADDV